MYMYIITVCLQKVCKNFPTYTDYIFSQLDNYIYPEYWNTLTPSFSFQKKLNRSILL